LLRKVRSADGAGTVTTRHEYGIRRRGHRLVEATDQGRKDRRHVSSKSKTVVTEKVAEWERARDDGLAQEIQENWTVEAWLTHWLEHLSRPFVKQSTYEGYRAAVNVHLITGIGRHRLHTLRPEHLERLYVSMLKLSTRRGTTMSPGRVHQVHRTIRTALNDAVQRGHLARNPAEMAKTPPVNDYDVEPYTVDELQQLSVAAQQESNGARWVFALALCLRQGEALGLQRGDVDWSLSVQTIKRSRTRPRYEHRLTATWRVGSTCCSGPAQTAKETIEM
jgi:integrase